MIATAAVAMATMAWLGAGGCTLYNGSGGCDWNGRHYQVGDIFPKGDGCNTCQCQEGGDVVCTVTACVDGGAPDAGPLPDALPACAPSGGCQDGPACGNGCCGAGEQCVNDTCMCGGNAACTGGDTCSPVGPGGGDLCGAVCCGVSGPCPL